MSKIIRCCALAALASAQPGGWSVAGQTEIPVEVRRLPIWPGAAEALRKYPDNFVFRETTGELVLSYPDPGDPGHRITSRFWLQNRVAPRIRAAVTRNAGGTYEYRYAVENGPSAARAIWKWLIVAPSSKETSVTHSSWQGINAYQSVSAPQALLTGTGPGSYLGWMDALGKTPITPGNAQSGFQIISPLRPGITTAYVSGLESPIKVSEDVPDSMEREITQLERPEIMNKVSVTIGPRFTQDIQRSEIVRAFENDIRDLKKLGMLASDSAFLHQFEQELHKAETTDEGSVFVPDTSVRTDLEQEIYESANLSLSFRP